MFCPKCGTELRNDAKFCKKCGERINVTGPMSAAENSINPPLQGSNIPQENIPMQGTYPYGNQQMMGSQQQIQNQKRTSVIIVGGIGVATLVAVMMVIVVLVGNGDSKYIDFVREGSPEIYPNTTYEEAFDAFFADPKWTYFEASTGEDVVEFSGDCTYGEEEVTATIQFQLNYDEGTFVATYLEFDGENHTGDMLNKTIETVFDEYQSGDEDHEIYQVEGSDAKEPVAEEVMEQDMEDLPAAQNTIYENNNYNNSSFTYTDWIDSYTRSNGPYCELAVWDTDETSITFSVVMGSVGYLAYVDMRDCVAYFTDYGYAVYSDEYSGYELDISMMEDGSIYIVESGNNPYDISLSGYYEKDSVVDEETCAYVFPRSDTIQLDDYSCCDLTATECKIARNEIYARHGRRFKDEMLQAYFDSCPWYYGYIEPNDFTEDMLNDIERKNTQIISTYEVSMGYK